MQLIREALEKHEGRCVCVIIVMRVDLIGRYYLAHKSKYGDVLSIVCTKL
jgi:hypothetical protein